MKAQNAVDGKDEVGTLDRGHDNLTFVCVAAKWQCISLHRITMFRKKTRKIALESDSKIV